MPSELIRRARASYEWVNALDLSSKQQYREALKKIEKVERMITRNGSTLSTFEVHLYLLKAVVLIKLGQLADALALVKRLNPIIKPGLSAEKDYLRAFLSVLARGIVVEMPSVEQDRELDALMAFDPRSVDFAKVPQDIRRNFPIPFRFVEQA